MSTPPDLDLVIVGAGPAGAATALAALAAVPGLRVALIDKAAFPRDKVCGDGVSAEGIAVLERLGVIEVLDGYPPRYQTHLVAPGGAVAEGRAQRPGRVIPRAVLDARLVAAAVARGADLLHRRITTIETRADHVRITGPGGEDPLTARWLVAADGANSTVRRLVGAGTQPPGRRGLAMRAYAHGPSRELSIGFVPRSWPAYVWAFATGAGPVNVGFGTFDARLVSGRADLLDPLLEEVARLEPGLTVDPATLRAHHLPLSSARPPPTVGRTLLVGDAASLIHPLTGEGIYYALLSGEMAGAAVARHPGAADDIYRRGLRARLGRHLRHTTMAARLFRSTVPVDLAVRAAAADPATFDRLYDFALGTGVITPSAVMTLARHAVRRS